MFWKLELSNFIYFLFEFLNDISTTTVLDNRVYEPWFLYVNEVCITC